MYMIALLLVENFTCEKNMAGEGERYACTMVHPFLSFFLRDMTGMYNKVHTASIHTICDMYMYIILSVPHNSLH